MAPADGITPVIKDAPLYNIPVVYAALAKCKYVLNSAVVAEYWLVTDTPETFTFEMPFAYVVNGSVPVVSRANEMSVTVGIIVAGVVFHFRSSFSVLISLSINSC